MTHSSDTDFNPALTGSPEDGLFGLPTTLDSSRVVLIPVPWEVTTSYGGGTADGPDTILKASPQLDLFQRDLPDHYQQGFHLLETDGEVRQLNERWQPVARRVQDHLESHGSLEGREDLVGDRESVNAASDQVNDWVTDRCAELDDRGKLPAVIGGDHSAPYGLIRYLCNKHRGDIGVLHLDAHLDLREAYQGFSHSHASIMHNVMALPEPPHSLVQVGIRDFCEEEFRQAESDSRIHVFYDDVLRERIFQGEAFQRLVAEVLAPLPRDVYISFDIDGLSPDLCPATGTPVPGGLDFGQARYLLKSLVRSGRRIVGFDLCEVAPDPYRPDDEWNGNVGARVLFQLASWMLESRS